MAFDLGVFSDLGREEDDTIAHVATGERVIPNGILDSKLSKKINSKMEAMGLDPEQYIVGNKKNSINPATGVPEFFLGGLFGGGSNRAREESIELAEASAAELAALQERFPEFFGAMGESIRRDPETGAIIIEGSPEQQAQIEAFQNLFEEQSGRVGEYEREMLGAMEDPLYGRAELMDMFTANLPSAERGIVGDVDSQLSRILGGGGISSGSAQLMADAQGRADLARSQLRQGAYTAADEAYQRELEGRGSALANALGLRSTSLGQLAGLAEAQGLPYRDLYGSLLPAALDWGGTMTDLDFAKIMGQFNMRKPAYMMEHSSGGGLGGILGSLAGAAAGHFLPGIDAVMGAQIGNTAFS